MKRFFAIATGVFILLMALMGSAVVYGHTLPTAPIVGAASAGLGICGGKLCLLQISPGSTSYSAAKQILADHISRDEQDHFHGQVGDLAVRVAMDSTGLQIREVDVQTSANPQGSPSVSLSTIIEQFGTPCYVAYVRSGSVGIDLAYPSFIVSVRADQEHVTLNSPVSGITLANNSDLSANNRSCGSGTTGIPWRGFASLQLYGSLQQDSGQMPQYGGFSYPDSSFSGARSPYGP